MLSKRKSHAFGKDIYLIGKDKSGTNYWLESPSWDCDWYWGFGYIETYVKCISGNGICQGVIEPPEEFFELE
jgi:hypothetical protein